jgi:hypothetical protein
MFDFFKKKVLNPLISKTVGEMDDALKVQNVTDRIENLLSAKEAAETSFLKISNREGIQGSAAMLLMIGGFPAGTRDNGQPGDDSTRSLQGTGHHAPDAIPACGPRRFSGFRRTQASQREEKSPS